MIVTIEETNTFQADVDPKLTNAEISQMFNEGGIENCTLLDEGKVVVRRKKK